MIVWLTKAGVNEVSKKPYAYDQRARIITAEHSEKDGLRLIVEMCGTGEYLGIHPRFVRGVELTPGITVVFDIKSIRTTMTNGQLTT